MSASMPPKNPHFIPFDKSTNDCIFPQQFSFPFDHEPHPLCLLAAEQLQKYLENQTHWEHNFGLTEGKEGKIIGKMFGVLVVENAQKEVGYLAAFSGKLAGQNHHPYFVPPVFDSLQNGGFLNEGMEELTRINQAIKALQLEKLTDNHAKIEQLKTHRKEHSIALQSQLHDQYHFLNQAQERKGLRAIFQDYLQQNPPSGAGECAAPKLLQYAFQHQMKPLAIAEFWWGLSPKSDFWKHQAFYPVCKEKCEPILSYMLERREI